jgi:hypothetical protein
MSGHADSLTGDATRQLANGPIEQGLGAVGLAPGHLGAPRPPGFGKVAKFCE